MSDLVLVIQIASKSSRLLTTAGPGCRSPGPTDNTDHQAVNHFQFPVFCKEELVLHLCIGNNLTCLTLLVSLEICGGRTLCHAPKSRVFALRLPVNWHFGARFKELK